MAADLPQPRDAFMLEGAEAQERALVEAMERGRLHHAWLLTGPEGIGKATFAFRAARRLLGRNVRVGRPLGVAGLPEAAKGPAFSATVGLLIYPQVAMFESHPARGISRLKMTGTGGKLHRMSQWLRDSF